MGVKAYIPPPDFVEDAKEALLDIEMNENTELWLIQWPSNQPPDFHDKEVTLKLHHDGKLGSFEGLSGKEYDLVSYDAQKPNATVFLSSSSGSRVVGKISRGVSLVHYADPKELEKVMSNKSKLMHHRSGGTSLMNSSRQLSTLTQNTMLRSSRGSAGSNGRHRSFTLEAGERSKSSKKRKSDGLTKSIGHDAQHSCQKDSAVTSKALEHSRDQSGVVTSGSLGHSKGDPAVPSGSHRSSSKKKKKTESEE